MLGLPGGWGRRIRILDPQGKGVGEMGRNQSSLEEEEPAEEPTEPVG